jgi:hypothetical protein
LGVGAEGVVPFVAIVTVLEVLVVYPSPVGIKHHRFGLVGASRASASLDREGRVVFGGVGSNALAEDDNGEEAQ